MKWRCAFIRHDLGQGGAQKGTQGVKHVFCNDAYPHQMCMLWCKRKQRLWRGPTEALDRARLRSSLATLIEPVHARPVLHARPAHTLPASLCPAHTLTASLCPAHGAFPSSNPKCDPELAIFLQSRVWPQVGRARQACLCWGVSV